MRNALIAVCVFVIVLTALNRVTLTPFLFYSLYPGLMVHLLITGAHGGTLAQEKIGFVAELLTNLTIYVSLALVCLRLARWSR